MSFLTSSGQVFFILIMFAIAPLQNLTPWERGTKALHFTKDPSCCSSDCLLRSSFPPLYFPCFSHIQTVSAQKHVDAHGSSCSISKLLISENSESETEGFPAAPTSLLHTSLRVGSMPGALAPNNLPGTTPISETVCIPLLMYAILNYNVFLVIPILCTPSFCFSLYLLTSSCLIFLKPLPKYSTLSARANPSASHKLIFDSKKRVRRNKLVRTFFFSLRQR